MKKLLVIALLIGGMAFSASAQPGFDDDVQDTPIDGGIVLLAAAGLAMGARAAKNKE